MGKSIIFVGRTNLNKNFDNQSMYKSDYGHYLKLDRDQFYRDLCEACRTCPGKKKRNNKISRLRSKYQGYSCSERTMEKVFTAYLECFGRPMGQPEYRKKARLGQNLAKKQPGRKTSGLLCYWYKKRKPPSIM